jgi:8-oxo-dGTP pyrophosphatase MutT (NUDIX family)
MSFVERLQTCSLFEPADYLPFLVDGCRVGLVRPEFAARLAGFPQVFEVSSDCVWLAPDLNDADVRGRAVEAVLRQLADDGLIRSWRNEPYAVAATPEGALLFLMERAAIPQFGIWATGVHLNGFVRKGDELFMWVGRRSPDKHVAPNKLDQLVAGGRSALHGIRETLLKEAQEEAGLNKGLAARAIAVGALSYRTRRREGLRRDVLYVFDLELPPDFAPVNHDGEIATFELWPIDKVLERVRDTDDFKFNCALVAIDFLIRHGVLTPENEPDYLTLTCGMRVR